MKTASEALRDESTADIGAQRADSHAQYATRKTYINTRQIVVSGIIPHINPHSPSHTSSIRHFAFDNIMSSSREISLRSKITESNSTSDATAEHKPNAPLSTLPDEIKLGVLGHLENKDLARLIQASKVSVKNSWSSIHYVACVNLGVFQPRKGGIRPV